MSAQVEHPAVRAMSAIEKSEAQMRVAQTDPNHFKQWLAESGRTWLVFNGPMFVDASWPDGCKLLQVLVANYRDHRAGLREPLPETLTIEELDRAIRYFIAQASALDPSWKLENNPL